ARFRQRAPQVNLHLHVGPIGMIERGVIDGQYHLGIIPEHRRSESLDYLDLFGETMQLYAAWGHPWFGSPDDIQGDETRDWNALQKQPLAALGYHSPNMALTHARRLERAATASDQEAVATLILSGAYVGFLPDHYARVFVEAGQMHAVSPTVLRYECRFACIWRHAPGLLRMAEAFKAALQAAHAGGQGAMP
ncbi:MAG TPA: substrate-binding domain-containing protein, partial [Hydrogenophaga sp.]